MSTNLKGHFGSFGGRYVPESLSSALDDLEKAYKKYSKDLRFSRELKDYQKNYVGRPTPLYFAKQFSQKIGSKIYLKREDLNHTGAHKINNTLGQILLAKRMKKSRIIAETGAGQHGVATATVAALFDLECVVYMGEEDMERQSLNVFRMRLLGAEVVPVSTGTKTLKDATSEAIRDWSTNVTHTHYIIGSTVGPHPYPMMVRDFQSVIGKETRRQILRCEKRLPDVLIACVGGGSNAMGLFYPFLKDKKIKMYGIEAAGKGIRTKKHCATLSKGRVGVLHGSKSYLLQDPDGQVLSTHSISAGLDYPGVGPEHSFLKESKRVRYDHVTDHEALRGLEELSRLEGIIPALESAHAIAYLMKKKSLFRGRLIVLNLSGRGDKDVESVSKYLGQAL